MELADILSQDSTSNGDGAEIRSCSRPAAVCRFPRRASAAPTEEGTTGRLRTKTRKPGRTGLIGNRQQVDSVLIVRIRPNPVTRKLPRAYLRTKATKAGMAAQTIMMQDGMPMWAGPVLRVQVTSRSKEPIDSGGDPGSWDRSNQ